MWYLLLLLMLFGVSLYVFRRTLLAHLLGLSSPEYAVGVERSIPVTMADGARLLTDHYSPKADGDFPTILIRTPYGRGREVFFFGGYPMAELPGQRFAERGYHVIVQGVRGCYDSEGEFEPHVNEAADGQAAVQWISEQPWFDGRLAVWGPSYLGYTAWATAAVASSQVMAIVPVITSAENYTVSHPNGAFGLETRLRWSQGLVRARQLSRQPLLAKFRRQFFESAEETLQAAFNHLPLLDADEIATGQPVPFYREMLAHNNVSDGYWTSRDHSHAVAQLEAPVHLVGGWYDYYLPGLLRDYMTLKNAGRHPHLTIGPWYHASAAGLMTGLREGLDWFEQQLKERQDAERNHPVRIFVMGADQWRQMDEFPPPSRPEDYFLHSGGLLSTDIPQNETGSSTYIYDPADPTPALGGALLAFKGAGPVDNRPLEARPDVLCFTSTVIREPIEIIGPAGLTLHVRSSRPHTDFHGRLCDVFPDGRSINICDGLIRLAPGSSQDRHGGALRITIELTPTAYRFLPGHRIRLQVSSGAHPRWNRNLGTGEDESTAVTMVAAEQTVFYGRGHPSVLRLPFV
jgi:hypothetical protein